MQESRRFLFLQGPHGPFFRELATSLRFGGHRVLKVALNEGDEREWGAAGSLERYAGDAAGWPVWIAEFLKDQEITDIVLYGDTRDYHAQACRAAKSAGAKVHCFEEGYVRPYWVTYERDGVNGNSHLMNLSVAEMALALRGRRIDLQETPAHWGSVTHHIYYGLKYHFFVMFRNGAYPGFARHRPTSVSKELRQYLRRMFALPFLTWRRSWRERNLVGSGMAYDLVLLQLAVDSSMRCHSRFKSVAEFMELCAKNFAEGAPEGHNLVFKAHPFEDGREGLDKVARKLARDYGLEGRIQFLEGGRLARLLDHARAVVTINSTAAQQALWRGLPVSAHGDAVFRKPELISEQPLDEFFRDPRAPDNDAYLAYRRFLLASSQLRGGFYTKDGIANAVSAAPAGMLADLDPYERLMQQSADIRRWRDDHGQKTSTPEVDPVNLSAENHATSVLRG